jgi:hypothetical protein
MIHDKDETSCPWCRLKKKAHMSEAGRHFRNARREVLLGMRYLIEAGLDHLEPDPEGEEGPARKVDIT